MPLPLSVEGTTRGLTTTEGDALEGDAFLDEGTGPPLSTVVLISCTLASARRTSSLTLKNDKNFAHQLSINHTFILIASKNTNNVGHTCSLVTSTETTYLGSVLTEAIKALIF